MHAKFSAVGLLGTRKCCVMGKHFLRLPKTRVILIWGEHREQLLFTSSLSQWELSGRERLLCLPQNEVTSVTEGTGDCCCCCSSRQKAKLRSSYSLFTTHASDWAPWSEEWVSGENFHHQKRQPVYGLGKVATLVCIQDGAAILQYCREISESQLLFDSFDFRFVS